MKEEIKKELEELSPFLLDLPKTENYDVPFNYFESLSDKVLEKVPPRNEHKISWVDRLVNLVVKKRIAFGIATSIILIAGFWSFSRSDSHLPSYETIANEITPQEFKEYIAEEIDDYSIEVLQELDIDFSVSFDEIESIEDEFLDEILDEFEDYELEQI